MVKSNSMASTATTASATTTVTKKVICYVRENTSSKWHPSTTPTLKKRFIDFSLLKRTLEKLYLKSKEDLGSPQIKEKCVNVYASPPSLVHSTNCKWNPLTPSLQQLDFIELRNTIEKLYSGECYNCNSNKIEKSLKF